MSNLTADQRVSDTELRMLIGDMEAHGKSRSITQNWMLSAFRELQALRAAGPLHTIDCDMVKYRNCTNCSCRVTL